MIASVRPTHTIRQRASGWISYSWLGILSAYFCCPDLRQPWTPSRMVKVISSTNAARSCRLHWDLQAVGRRLHGVTEPRGGVEAEGTTVTPIKSSRKPHVSRTCRSKREEEAWGFFEALLLPLCVATGSRSCSTTWGVIPPFVEPPFPPYLSSSVTLDTWLGAATRSTLDRDGGREQSREGVTNEWNKGKGVTFCCAFRERPVDLLPPGSLFSPTPVEIRAAFFFWKATGGWV